MKTIFILSVCLVMTVSVQAQNFSASDTVKLNNSIVHTSLESADMNGDGLLDLVLFNKNTGDDLSIQFLQGDSIAFKLLHDSTRISIDVFSSYSILDYDFDNQADIVLFGDSTFLYRNMGGFEFERVFINLPALRLARWVDLDNNGSREIVGSLRKSGEFTTLIYVQQSDSTWESSGNTISLNPEAIEIVDANRDGYHDLYVSGLHSPDSLFSGFLLNEKDFAFSASQGNPWLCKTASGDLNGDGVFDVIVIGIDANSSSIQKSVMSTATTFEIVDSPWGVVDGSLFISDLNADGSADISVLGKTATDTVHILYNGSASPVVTALYKLMGQDLADFDRDGNLDLVQITNPDSIHITLYRNESVKNEGPSAPPRAVSTKIFDRYFFYWEQATDDRTNAKSLTYDLFVTGTEVLQPVAYDFGTDKRFTITHGNNLTQTFKLFELLPIEPTAFGIQAVDNSFQTRDRGICMGTVQPCSLEAEVTVHRVCPGESILLNAPAPALWFSFSEGYLGTFTEYNFEAEADTLFYFDPMVFDCTALQVHVIDIQNKPRKEVASQSVCVNSVVELSIEDSWHTVQWTSMLNGDMGQNRSIQFVATAPDTITAHLHGEGCDVIRKTAIKITEPPVTIEDEHYVIIKGGHVQLHASGALRYEWSPVTDLSDPHVPNPIASPIEPITYTVTGYDVNDCAAQKSVTVTVEKTGFIPNLFTPNNDGKNDHLRIYGMTDARSFNFRIYNRDGVLVYETESVAEVLNQGWDGTKGTSKQPAAVYYWKVKGKLQTGEDVRLNGKTEGSIILVR